MPPAVLAWLDYSEADQRRAREIVRMFSQPESRDELGLGQIRDALSDTLFPGTSVLLTRARYLLFVPWLYREGVRLRRQGSQLSSWVDTQERRLIGALRNVGDSSGLFGGVVGEQVQNLPSTIYWNSLRRFGILRHDGTPTQIAGLRQASRPLDDTTEFVERSDAVWDPSMPGPPEDFFALTSCDFTLTRDEATWLAERIGQAAPDTRNCSDLRGSADYSAYCGGATEHGISTANRFRPLKREQLPTPCSSSWSGKVADALTSPSSPGTITRSMLPWARSATRSTRLDGSPPQCTEPPWFTTCSSPSAPRNSGFLSTRGDGTISPAGLINGAMRLRNTS